MITIFKIFFNDIKGLMRNLMAVVVAGALCLIPSLYAWFNIYSNWDPYANTGSIKIAVVSEDAGYSSSDSDYVNMGDSVIENLHDNNKIGWVFCDNSNQALDGVYNGDYYAAIIFGDDFSRNLYDFLDNGLNHPSVHYYENDKKNAVAVKITDSAKSSLQETINQQFIEVVAKTIIENLNELEVENPQLVSELTTDITKARDNLMGYSKTMDAFRSSNAALADNLDNLRALLPQVSQTLQDSADTAGMAESAAQQTADSINSKLDDITQRISGSVSSAQLNLEKASEVSMSDPVLASQYVGSAAENLSELSSAATDLETTLDTASTTTNIDSSIITSIKSQLNSVSIVQEILENILKQTETVTSSIANLSNASSTLMSAKTQLLSTLLDTAKEHMTETLNAYNSILSDSLGVLESAIISSASAAQTSLTDVNLNIDNIDKLLSSSSDMIRAANKSLEYADASSDKLIDKMNAILDFIGTLDESALYDKIETLLNADSGLYSEFIAEPVKVTQIDVYPATNYGTAVTPFYTALAIWVGGIILVAIVKVHVDNTSLADKAHPYQLYLGRFLLFFVMGQIQALIIALGDLYLLKISCVHPGLFITTACIISFVFTLLIYTLVVSFGDIGKAIAVVMVVIQIAGSSGTFPIEILPSFFKNVYLYFPFPYAINAMREAISGTYELNYLVYMSKLSIFAILSLILGLLLRIPFVPLNNFFRKKMDDTEMM